MTGDERSPEKLLAEIAELRGRLDKAEAALSERMRAEEALRQNHERLQKVLEIQTVGMMFWDLGTGCMTDANDTFLKTMGYSRAEVEAGELTWQKLTPPEYMELSRSEVAKFQASGSARTRRSISARTERVSGSSLPAARSAATAAWNSASTSRSANRSSRLCG